MPLITGRLAAVACAATTNNVIYTVPAGAATAAVTINVASLDTSATTIRLAISTSGTPTSADWINYDYPLAAKNAFERTGLILSQGEKIILYTPSSLITVRVHGYEEA